MSPIQADYYDGKTSVRHPVSLLVGAGKLKVIGEQVNEMFDLRRVRRSLRIANTPRWLYLPGGGACVTQDNDAIDGITRTRRYDRVLQNWESRPVLAALAVALVALSTWLLIDRALPVAADEIARRIPREAERLLGESTLQGMDRFLLQPSKLSPARQEALRAKFADLVQRAGDGTPYRLEFRASPVGANAFALPSGVIVMLYAEDSLHYWRKLVWRLGVKGGMLERMSMGEIMSRQVERSATEARPLVKAYTARRARALFDAFRDVEIVQRQLEPGELPRSLRWALPQIERRFGWNLIVKANKR